jgi:hypothetical protein
MNSNKETAGPVESDLRKKSRIAAFWYMLVSVTGPFLLFYIPSKFIVPGNAAATIANIMASQTLFRFGIVISFISTLSFLFTGLALYALFKPVDKGQARTMVALVAASVPFAFITTLFQIAALLLASGADYLKAFEPAQLQSLAMIFLNLDKQGSLIAEIFWGLWLLPLGILVFKSGFFPKILGVFQVIACFGYLAGFLVSFLFPGVRGMIPRIINVMIFGELPFILWLIIRGARLKPPRKAAPAGA